MSENLRILIAEDNLMNQRLIEKQLRLLGSKNFKIVENGNQAVEEVEKEKFDVILRVRIEGNGGGAKKTD